MLLMQSTIPCAPITGICSQTAQSLRISSITQTTVDAEVLPAKPEHSLGRLGWYLVRIGKNRQLGRPINFYRREAE